MGVHGRMSGHNVEAAVDIRQEFLDLRRQDTMPIS